MKISRNQASPREVDRAGPARASRGRQSGWALACIVAAVVLAGAAFPRQQPQVSPGSGESNSASQAASVPAVPAQPETAEENVAQHGSDGGSLQSSQQIAEESAKLLKLATDLKAEVDKTNKDTLSLRVVRKADEIERLAHNVRIRMRAVVAAN